MFLDSLYGYTSDEELGGERRHTPLRAHAYDGTRGRSDECDALLCETLRKVCILAKESVPRVNCLGKEKRTSLDEHDGVCMFYSCHQTVSASSPLCPARESRMDRERSKDSAYTIW